MKYKCPFCEKELADAQTPCCGEAGHAVEDDEQNLLEQHMAAQAADESEMDQ